MNDALCLKIVWTLYKWPEDLWACVLFGKYEYNGFERRTLDSEREELQTMEVYRLRSGSLLRCEWSGWHPLWETLVSANSCCNLLFSFTSREGNFVGYRWKKWLRVNLTCGKVILWNVIYILISGSISSFLLFKLIVNLKYCWGY